MHPAGSSESATRFRNKFKLNTEVVVIPSDRKFMWTGVLVSSRAASARSWTHGWLPSIVLLLKAQEAAKRHF